MTPGHNYDRSRNQQSVASLRATAKGAPPPRGKTQTTTFGGWVFGIPERIGTIFKLLTGSHNRLGMKSSPCAKDLHVLAKKYPIHQDAITVIGRLVELEESGDDLLTIAKTQKQKEKFQETKLVQNSEEIKRLKGLRGEFQGRAERAEKEAERAEKELARVKGESNLFESSISYLADPNLREKFPILWGQSLDLVSKKIPKVLGIMGQAGVLGRLHPPEDSDSVCTLKKVATSEVDWAHEVEATFFMTAKQERGRARDSEDRIGFLTHENGYRAIALDGVGGSTHSRHLVRELGERVLDADDFRASIEDTLRVVGEGQVEDKVMVAADDKLAWLQKQRLSDGAACVLAAVDYDFKNSRATVHQIGDTVAFVQLPRRRWAVIPKALSDGKSFDSRPQQLNCKDPSGVSQIETVQIAKATGVIALATDGVAEHILLNGGIRKFIERVRKHDGDGNALLGELRREGIADDDLSFLLIDPQ